MFMLKTNGMLAVIPHYFPPNCGSLWREETTALMYFLATFVCLHLKGESKEKLWGKKTKQTAPKKKHFIEQSHTFYISVIQKQSFLSPPITQRGSVRCQLRPEPTVADPIVTGCKDIGVCISVWVYACE